MLNFFKKILLIIIILLTLPLIIVVILWALSQKKKIQITPTFKILDAKEADEKYMQTLDYAIQEAKKALKQS